MGFIGDMLGFGDQPKIPPPPPPQKPPPMPQDPVYSQDAAARQRNKASAAIGAQATNVTGGTLTASADTGKKALTGQ